MDLVVHQVVELEEVDVAHGDGVVKPLAGAAVVQPVLAVHQTQLAGLLPLPDLDVVRHLLRSEGPQLAALLLGCQIELLADQGSS